MRILMVSQFYPPVIGGEERAVHDLSSALARRGHDVAVATLWHDDGPRVDREGDVRVHRIRSATGRLRWLHRDPERRHVPPLPDPEAVLGLRRVIRRERPEIVHAHDWLSYSLLPLPEATRNPIVMSLHDYGLVCANKRYMRLGVECDGPRLAKCMRCAGNYFGAGKGVVTSLGHRSTTRHLRAVVALYLPVSEAVAARSGLVGSRVPFEVIPNFRPDDVENSPPDGNEGLLERLPSGDFLMFAGDHSYEKGLGDLLRAHEMLDNAPPLVLIGRPHKSTPIKASPRVLPLGLWPHAAVLQAWRRALIAVVPSRWPEPFGLVALEAMAMGRPVIAARSGGLAELVVDGVTGVLVTPGDVAGLRDGIARLLADAPLRESMGRAGERRAGEYGAAVVIARIERAYERALARAGARPSSSGSPERSRLSVNGG